MPNNASARKRLRQNKTRNAENRVHKTILRNHVKKVRKAIADKDAATAETAFVAAVKKLDKAVARNLLHKNAAARTKSRLNAQIKAVKQG